jgi:hypothetical protein
VFLPFNSATVLAYSFNPFSTIFILSYAVDKQTGLPNILIDDRPKNLEKWIAKGGFGIRYQANEDSIKIVEKGLKLYARTVAELKGKNTESKVTQVDKKSMPKENELG